MSKKKHKKGEDKKQKKNKEKDFDKYKYYLRSVQSPDADVEFLRDTFKSIKGKLPETLCEDFCGTFKICCEWVKLNEKFKSIGVDLDPEPLQYGLQNHLPKLSPSQIERIEIKEANVLDRGLPKADMVAAMNFSYYLFKERKQLLEYFKSAYDRVGSNGLFVVDAFGGPDCMQANEEITEHEGFNYYWDQDSFDPISNFAQFYIHFKVKGEKKRHKVFSYDWRMWSIPELKDCLAEVGFKNTHVYWEGDDGDGAGNGEYKRVDKGEEVDAWVAYLVSEK